MRTMIEVFTAAALLVAATGAGAEIRIGQTTGLTGTVAASVNEARAGAMLYIDSVNARGGINGEPIALVSMDDKFDPKLTAENGKKLIADPRIVALFLNRGTPNTQALMPLLEAGKIALVGPSTGAMVLHTPFNRYIFNVRSTYQSESEKAVTHLTNLGILRIGIVLADDSFGADGAAGAATGFRKAGVQPLFTEKYDRTTPDFKALSLRVAQANPQAIVFVGSGTAVADGVKAIKAAGARPLFVTLSNNAANGFIKQMGANARGMIVTQVYPFEGSRATPMVNEAYELTKAAGLGDMSPASLEGFAAAKVLVEGLRRAGPKPTRQSVLRGLESIKNFDLGGLVLSYSTEAHDGLAYTDLSIINKEGKFAR